MFLKKCSHSRGATPHSSQTILKMCTFFTTLESIVHLPIILPYSSVIEIPTGTGISQSFPFEPFSALTLRKKRKGKKKELN